MKLSEFLGLAFMTCLPFQLPFLQSIFSHFIIILKEFFKMKKRKKMVGGGVGFEGKEKE